MLSTIYPLVPVKPLIGYAPLAVFYQLGIDDFQAETGFPAVFLLHQHHDLSLYPLKRAIDMPLPKVIINRASFPEFT